jgi:uncharacterized membrane protein
MKYVIVLLCAVFLFSACSKKPVYPEAPFDGNNIRIELSAIPEKKPVFFTYSAGGEKINFFLLRRDGKIESYFDACGKCYPQKLGFKLEGDHVVCRACNVRYHIDDLKEGIGSCYPIRLKGRVEGNTFVIEKNDILKGKQLF